MFRKSIWTIVLVLGLAIMGGCNDDSSEQATEPNAMTPQELRSEAEAEINEENLEDQLNRLEEEIESETQNQQ